MSAGRLLLLSVSAGAGHVRAAQALESWAHAQYPELVVQHVDLLRVANPGFRKVYGSWYLRLVKHCPGIWRTLYNWTDRPAGHHPGSRMRMAVESLCTRRLKCVLRDFRPDCVICTHFLPGQLMSRQVRHRRWSGQLWIQITDFDCHRLWLAPGATGFFATNEEVADRMRTRGIPAGIIHVTGIPIMPQFSRIPPKTECRQVLGLASQAPTLLLMAGGCGTVGLDHILAPILESVPGCHAVAVAGRNKKLQTRLRLAAGRFGNRARVMGFTDTVELVMGACDLVVTKPGGLTTSECLAAGLPMILVSPIAGQEERNCDYLVENGAALKAPDLDGLLFRAQHLLRDPERLRAISDGALRLSRPGAARDVLKLALDPPPTWTSSPTPDSTPCGQTQFAAPPMGYPDLSP